MYNWFRKVSGYKPDQNWFFKLITVSFVLVLSSCVTIREPYLEGQSTLRTSVASFNNPSIRIWGDASAQELLAYSQVSSPELKVYRDLATGKPTQDFLVLSGGGSKGAFGSGLLNGWTKSGTRPEFTVVTGVSTGALIAPFAFLGPSYDSTIEEFYTIYSTKDILRANLFNNSSLADSSPLARLIAKYFTKREMRKIASEYSKGRFLLIGTTNLDAKRPVIWNIGEIASIGDDRALKLIHKVLLASASIPGAFPPVLVDVSANGKSGQELHVDGGTTNNVFLFPPHFDLKSYDKLQKTKPKRRIFVLINSNLGPEEEQVKVRVLDIAAKSISTLIQQQTGGDVLELYDYSKRNDIEFYYNEIPDGFKTESKELFDKAYMKDLYNTGNRIGLTGGSWKRKPRAL